jgi:hypothetical protein
MSDGLSELAKRFHELVRLHAELSAASRRERDIYGRTVYLIDSNDVFNEACKTLCDYLAACNKLIGQA